jgi:hypothetical protein
VFAVLIAKNQLITLVRPKSYSLHPGGENRELNCSSSKGHDKFIGWTRINHYDTNHFRFTSNIKFGKWFNIIPNRGVLDTNMSSTI